MGSFNVVCALTNLPIAEGDKVYVIPVVHSPYVSTMSDWLPYGGMIEAEYDDYGGFENTVVSAFTQSINKSFGFNVCANSFNKMDPYSTAFNSIIPGFSEKIKALPSLATLEDVNPEILISYGFTQKDEVTYTWGDAVITLSYVKNIPHKILSATVTAPSFKHEEGIHSYASLFSVVVTAALALKGVGKVTSPDGEKWGLPGIPSKVANNLITLNSTQLVFVHKDAFNEFHTQLLSNEGLEYEAGENAKLQDAINKLAQLSTQLKTVKDQALTEAGKEITEAEREMRVSLASDLYLAKMDIEHFSHMFAMSRFDIFGFSEFASEEPEHMGKLKALQYGLFAEGKTFAPPGYSFQWSNLKMNALLQQVAQSQLKKLR